MSNKEDCHLIQYEKHIPKEREKKFDFKNVNNDNTYRKKYI